MTFISKTTDLMNPLSRLETVFQKPFKTLKKLLGKMIAFKFKLKIEFLLQEYLIY